MAADGSSHESTKSELLQPKKALNDDVTMYRLIAEEWKERFLQTLSSTDALLDISLAFVEDCTWRDLMVFTPDFRCLTPRSAIEEHFLGPIRSTSIINLRILPHLRPQQLSPTQVMIQGLLAFETSIAHCKGVYTLRQGEDGKWKSWALVTAVDSLIGVPARFQRPWGQQDEMKAPMESTSGLLNDQPTTITEIKSNYTAVIIGAGQSGLGLAAQLENVGIDVLIVEKAARAGDSWASRYESLKLNTPKSFSQLPFVPFPDELEDYFSGKQATAHFANYPAKLGLHISLSSTITSTSYDSDASLWNLNIQKHTGDALQVQCKYVMIATGVGHSVGSSPFVPDIPNKQEFQGTAMHSSKFRTSDEWKGKKAIVVGAGCSGHDIAQELVNSGAEHVTIVQRSPISVMSWETIHALFPGLYFGKNILPIDIADWYWIGLPLPSLLEIQGYIVQGLAHIDSDLYGQLRTKGYLLPNNEDDNFFKRLSFRMAGYYVDKGCCQMILEDKISIKSGSEIHSFTDSSLHFEDGSNIAADLVVFATGYTKRTLKKITEDVLGPTIAASVPNTEGWDSELEAIGLWRPTGHPGLYFAGGDFFSARFYSRILATRIKALEMGLISHCRT